MEKSRKGMNMTCGAELSVRVGVIPAGIAVFPVRQTGLRCKIYRNLRVECANYQDSKFRVRFSL
jgi:hypothetical protein